MFRQRQIEVLLPSQAFVVVLFILLASYNTCSTEAQVQSQQIILRTVDGVDISAFELTTGKSTMLIYCHRLLSSKESFDLTGFGNVFLREFDVLALDFRGHGQSGRASDCGGDEVLDLRTAILYAKKTGYRRIVLLGVGMGGIVAIREAALFGNVDAVVAVSPCAQPEKLKPWWWNLAADISLTTDYGEIPIRILSSARISGRYWTGSPVYLVDRVSPTPLLLVHGEGDRYLNDEQPQTLYDSAREPKKLLILPRSEHAEGLLNVPTAELIVAWLREVLPGQSSPAVDDSVKSLPLHPPIPINDIDIQGDVVLPKKMMREAIKLAADGASDLAEQLTRIKEEVEALHQIRGYTLVQASGVELTEDGKLSLCIEVGQIDCLTVDGNHYVPSDRIKQALRITQGHYYNAWELEAAVKRLRRFPVFANVENQLKQDADGNTVAILVRERRPWALAFTAHFTDFDQFGGIQLSVNELRSGVWRAFAQMLLGLQHRSPLYWVRFEKGWFRQEAQERGGFVSAAYRITDKATVHLGLSRKRSDPFDADAVLPVDTGFINALTLRLESKGRFLRRGDHFFNWRSEAFMETATTRARGDHDYTTFQLNVYPQLIPSSTQSLDFGLHWGHSWGDVPQQKLFSLGGDTTLPGYDDDAFVGERVFLIRVKYGLSWGKWLGETSRLAPLGLNLLLDAGDVRMRGDSLKFDSPRLELGAELNYASVIRLGFIRSLGKERARSHLYFGWHPHLIRPRL